MLWRVITAGVTRLLGRGAELSGWMLQEVSSRSTGCPGGLGALQDLSVLPTGCSPAQDFAAARRVAWEKVFWLFFLLQHLGSRKAISNTLLYVLS